MSTSLFSKVVRIDEVPFDDVRFESKRPAPVVLVVDDEQLVADTLALILTRAGFRAYTAYDGETAIRLAQELRPTLLISDVAMPGMNGVELATSLASLCPRCKILFFSGHATAAKLLDLLGTEIPYELLTKPVHPTAMLRQVSRMLQVGADTSPGVRSAPSLDLLQIA